MISGSRFARKLKVVLRRGLPHDPPSWRRHAWIPVLGTVLIGAWQASFARLEPGDFGHLKKYGNHAALGRYYEEEYVYFLHYLGLFPVAVEKTELYQPAKDGIFPPVPQRTLESLELSEEGARRALEEHGPELVTEVIRTTRTGERGRTFLFLVDVWLFGGDPRAPDIRSASTLFDWLALSALFVSGWWIRRTLLVGILTALLGSHALTLYETYGSAIGHALGWPVPVAVLVLALHLPILGRQPHRAFAPRIVLAVGTGILLALSRQIRPETCAIIASAAAAYLTLPRTRWWRRVVLVGLLGLSFAGTTRALHLWFEAKYREAVRVVTEAGGHPYLGPRDPYHPLWHNLWTGLGDFGGDKGYAWDDRAAYRYARPILAATGYELPPWDGESFLYYGTYWDPHGRYVVSPDEMPGYREVIRDKFLEDVTKDPLWYLGILLKRLAVVLFVTTPVQVAIGSSSFSVPFTGAFVLVLLPLLAVTRSTFLLKLVCFTLPVSAGALVVFSGRGMSYYSCYHLVMAGIVAAWVSAALWSTLRQARPALRSGHGP